MSQAVRDRINTGMDFARYVSLRVDYRRSRLAAFVLSGPGLPLLFVAVYALAYLRRFPLVRWTGIPYQTFVTITGPQALPALGLALADGVLLAWCWRMWRLALARPTAVTRGLVLVGWLGATLCALFTFPGQSTDMGDYIFRAHMLVHLHVNPLTTPPSQIIRWQNFPYLSWYWEPDFYGPLWQGLSGAVHALAGESLLANYLAYKALAATGMALSGWLIYRTLRQVAPSYALGGLALWLWNPMVLNEGPLHGHNDMLVVPLVLASLWLVWRGRGTPGMLVLVAAGLIKANIWFLLPVEAIWLLRRQGWRRGIPAIALAVLAGGGLVYLAYRPFGGWQLMVDMVRRRGWWPAATWTAAAFYALRDGLRWLSHAEAVRWVIGGGTAIFAALSTVALWRLRDLFVTAWAVTLAYLLVGSQWFQPWYAVWLIAIAALIPNRYIAGYMLVFSLFMLWDPIVQQYWLARITFPRGGYDAAMAAATLLIPQMGAAWLVVKGKIPRRSDGFAPVQQ